MTEALLYQPTQKWRMGAAFGAAALIHFAAIALAGLHQHEQIVEAPSLPPGIPVLSIEPASLIDDSTPPPDVPEPPSPPDRPDDGFPDARPSPPPIRRRTNRLVAPIAKASNGSPASLTSSMRVLALTAPRPEYPYEARRQKITGSGVVAMTVDPVTGSVTDVMMETSTGSSVLDNAAVTGFRRWRFRPGTISKVKSPITFTLAGAQY